MRIDLLELRLLRLPLVRAFETSFGRVTARTIVLVMVHAEEAVGLWDLFARQQGVALRQLLGGTRTAVPSGVSIGIESSIEALLDRIAIERDAGYQRVKLKIRPGRDTAVLERVRHRWPALPLMVDANAAYRLRDLGTLAALDTFDLLMIEQPLAEDDLVDHAPLQQSLRTPICLDESIDTRADAAAAIALAACRIVNIKPGRLGGHAEAIAVHDLCAAAGMPVWHGGMLEAGLGRAHNLHLGSLPHFSLPGDIAASERYFQPDLIEPPIRVASDGTIAVPDGPGIGVTIVPDRVDRATERRLAKRARAA